MMMNPAMMQQYQAQMQQQMQAQQQQAQQQQAQQQGAAGAAGAKPQPNAMPGMPGWMDKFEKDLETLKPDSMKGYTIGDNTHKNLSKHPWRLDDEKLAKARVEGADLMPRFPVPV